MPMLPLTSPTMNDPEMSRLSTIEGKLYWIATLLTWLAK